MKKFIYLLVAAMLGSACADEKPHFLPLPGGSVEIGGIGATASSEASSLTDSDLTTYFSAETGDDNTVEVIVPCNAGEIVAYTLVSSGEIHQDESFGTVEALYDPASWSVSGSNDGTSWIEVDSRSNEKFIARFQNHIYYLEAPANYTPVLGAPHYLFENPWGSTSWETPGDAGGNILRIDYAFDGTARSGLVYLPAIERNTYYTVCCRMNNSGKITVEYTVADWDDTDPWDDMEFNYPTYTNPVLPLENETMSTPTVYYNADESSTAGTFSCRFRMTAPSGQEWLPTLLDASPADFEVKVYQKGPPGERPVASANWYTITVRALTPDNVGRTVSLGVSYTPTWDPNQSKLLLINGTDSNHIEWPDSGNTPELIVITQVDPTNI